MSSCLNVTDFKSRNHVHRSVSCFILYFLLGRSPPQNIIYVALAKDLTAFVMSGAKQLIRLSVLIGETMLGLNTPMPRIYCRIPKYEQGKPPSVSPNIVI